MASTEHIEYIEHIERPESHNEAPAGSRETKVPVTEIKDNADGGVPDEASHSSGSEETLSPERNHAWSSPTDYPNSSITRWKLIPTKFESISLPQPVIALHVKEAEVKTTFFVHQYLLHNSTYFQRLFASHTDLNEHTLPPGPDVKTVGNYVSIVYSSSSSRYEAGTDTRTSLSQLISLARVFRMSSGLCLNHAQVYRRTYNFAKDLLGKLQLDWGTDLDASETIKMMQTAFLEWYGDFGPRSNPRKIHHKIVELFVDTCPEAVFETHVEGLDSKFSCAITRLLLKVIREQSAELLHKIPSSQQATTQPARSMTPSTAQSEFEQQVQQVHQQQVHQRQLHQQQLHQQVHQQVPQQQLHQSEFEQQVQQGIHQQQVHEQQVHQQQLHEHPGFISHSPTTQWSDREQHSSGPSPTLSTQSAPSYASPFHWQTYPMERSKTQ